MGKPLNLVFCPSSHYYRGHWVWGRGQTLLWLIGGKSVGFPERTPFPASS